MTRSKWKLPLVDVRSQISKHIHIWKRNYQIPHKKLFTTVYIHDGKEFRKINVIREKIGFKYGCFSYTRKHTKKIKNSKRNLKKNAKK